MTVVPTPDASMVKRDEWVPQGRPVVGLYKQKLLQSEQRALAHGKYTPMAPFTLPLVSTLREVGVRVPRGLPPVQSST